MTATATANICNSRGLHARASAKFVKLASVYDAEVHVTRDGVTVNALSIMGLLMLARQRFLWWPFHPLGFPISAVFGTMFFSVFLSWAIKSIVLKYGGPGLYLKTRPFFLGLILGQFVTVGIWYGIDYFNGASWNMVTSW